MDPFAAYEDFPARTYSLELEDAIEIVPLSSVVCQFARYAMANRVVVLTLSDYVTV